MHIVWWSSHESVWIRAPPRYHVVKGGTKRLNMPSCGFEIDPKKQVCKIWMKIDEDKHSFIKAKDHYFYNDLPQNFRVFVVIPPFGHAIVSLF